MPRRAGHDAGATLVACDPDVIESCFDRRRFVDRFAGSFRCPHRRGARGSSASPYARGSRTRGRGCVRLWRREALERRLAYGDDVIVQAYLPGVSMRSTYWRPRGTSSLWCPGSPSMTAARCGPRRTTTRSRSRSGSRRRSRCGPVCVQLRRNAAVPARARAAAARRRVLLHHARRGEPRRARSGPAAGRALLRFVRFRWRVTSKRS
jgi:hypothetical protein